MAEVVFERVSKVFPDGTVAVAELDLSVPDAEFMVLVGPSGSGKSTALRMLAGLEEVSAGAIRIAGKVVNELAPRDRDIAMVFQNYALYPHMNVGDNVGFGLKLRRIGRRERRDRVAESARMLGIADLLRRRPRELSGGQRQRVAMGRAIVREPQAFLMDEPLSNLDAKLRVEMRAYIALLHTRLATTTIYVTHDQIEAMTMGDRVAVMREGRLEQVDSPPGAVRAASQSFRRLLHRLPCNEPGSLPPRGGRRPRSRAARVSARVVAAFALRRAAGPAPIGRRRRGARYPP
jgi:multiple sugar transport system ATP-binding protein